MFKNSSQEVVEGGPGVIQKYWPLIYVESQPHFSDGDRRFANFGCREVITDRVFGLYEEEIDGVPVLTKQGSGKNVTIQREWAKCAQCVKYVRRNAWTAQEYLEQTPPSYSVALRRQCPVLLSPAKPDLSRFFLIPALDFVVGGFVKHSGVYDANEENIVRKLIREGDCILEIGANIGSYTVVGFCLIFSFLGLGTHISNFELWSQTPFHLLI